MIYNTRQAKKCYQMRGTKYTVVELFLTSYKMFLAKAIFREVRNIL